MTPSAKPQGRFVRLGLFVPNSGMKEKPHVAQEVTVYTKNHCPQCNATIRTLTNMGIPFETINLDDHPDQLEFVQREYGAQQAPVVAVKYGSSVDTWAGFNPGKLAEL